MLPQTLAMSSFGWFPKEWPLQITASFLGFFWFISCFQQWVKCCFLLSFCTGYCLFSSPQYLLDLADTLTFYRGAGMCEEGNKPQALLLKGQCLLQKQGAKVQQKQQRWAFSIKQTLADAIMKLLGAGLCWGYQDAGNNRMHMPFQCHIHVWQAG